MAIFDFGKICDHPMPILSKSNDKINASAKIDSEIELMATLWPLFWIIALARLSNFQLVYFWPLLSSYFWPLLVYIIANNKRSSLSHHTYSTWQPSHNLQVRKRRCHMLATACTFKLIPPELDGNCWSARRSVSSDCDLLRWFVFGHNTVMEIGELAKNHM